MFTITLRLNIARMNSVSVLGLQFILYFVYNKRCALALVREYSLQSGFSRDLTVCNHGSFNTSSRASSLSENTLTRSCLEFERSVIW